tara:strand:+ start:293 stop:967 length:675 start_codon:yes stop_codon:yes gene_type:complete
MSFILTKRILKGINEDIKLIYYLKNKEAYIFYILGTTDYIYKVSISKNYQRCNCEDYYKSKFCKHICFVLFKLFRLYKIDLSKFTIKFIYKDKLIETSLFDKRQFPEQDWSLFKLKFFNIDRYLNSKVVNKKMFTNFNNFYNQFHFLVNSKICNGNECVICYDKIDNGLKCPVCKNTCHTKCLMDWFNKTDVKKCPTCRSDYWNLCYKYMILLNDKKINSGLIL